MPKKEVVRRKTIQHSRFNDTRAVPQQPVDGGPSIQIPDEYRTYETAPHHREEFLLWDSGEQDEDRIFVFGRKSQADWSNQMKRLYLDGTFGLAPPPPFSQIYVIMADRGGFLLPIVYALLPNRQGETYRRMFQAIKEFWPKFDPSSVSIDFEQAAIEAVQSTFPNCTVHGCLFHLAKNMRTKLAEEEDLQLLQRYNMDPDFGLAARMIVALSFVPIDDLEDALEALADEITPDLIPIINWFEDSYIGRLNRNGSRRCAPFPPQIWSAYERTMNGEDCTNSNVEAAHQRLQAELGMDYPNVWSFIDGIIGVQKGTDQVYEQFIRGDQPPAKCRKYVAAGARIRNIVASYKERNIMEYLRGLAHNLFNGLASDMMD